MGSVLAQSGPVIPDFGGGGTCVRNNDTFCWGWFSDNWSDTFAPRLVEHVWLTVLALAIGFAIAFALLLLARRTFNRLQADFAEDL